MAIYSSGGTTYPDFYICLSLFILTLISVPLNSLVIRHNLLKQPSIPRNLFLLLAVCDLSASVYISIDFSVGALADKDIQGCMKSNLTREFCENYYEASFKDASVVDRIRSTVRYIFLLMPCYLTGILAITRYFQIKYPLRKIIKWKVIAGFLILVLCHVCLMYVLFYRKGDKDNEFVVYAPLLQSAWNMNPSILGFKFSTLQLFVIVNVFVTLLQLFAIFTSLLTILELIKIYKKPLTETAKRNSLTGSLRVLITNFGSVVSVCMFVVQSSSSVDSLKDFAGLDDAEMRASWEKLNIERLDGANGWNFWFMTACVAVFPLITSSLNPAIYILFTPETRILGNVSCLKSRNTTVQVIAETREL